MQRGGGDMGKHCIRILGTTALVTLAVGTTQAVAGGLALREQSAWGEGTSYAGVAAGGSLSAMFWNPATITQSGKMAIEASTSVLFPQSSQTGTATFLTPPLSALSPFGFTDQTPNSSEAAVLPSGYVAMQLTDRIWFGLSFNSPFGLSTNFENPGWAGAFYAQSSSLRTYNGAPTVAIKITDWLSVGGGVQIQYAEPHLLFATGATAPGTPTLGLLTGHGWTVGWTAGVTLTPTPWTQIGLGYRSALNQEIDGSFVAGSAGSTAITTVRWPDSASLGVRQGITSNLTLLGTVEWTGWKRIGTSVFNQSNGSPCWRQTASRSYFRSSSTTAGSIRLVWSISLPRIGLSAVASASKRARSQIRSAFRCCRTTTEPGIRSARPTGSPPVSVSTSPIRLST